MISCDPVEGYSTEDGDCDDGDATAFPGAEELCGDGIDSDCDGEDRNATRSQILNELM